MINICLRSPLSDDEFYNSTSHRQLFFDLGIPLSQQCPPSMKGLFRKNSILHPAVPSKILVFPGSEISYFLSQAEYPNDGRHYGMGMYLPFKRSLQGIAHEYAKATADKSSSLLALFNSPDKETRQRADEVWTGRSHSCYHEINVPDEFRIKFK